MKDIKFRAWNKYYKEMLSHEQLITIIEKGVEKETIPYHFVRHDTCLLAEIIGKESLREHYELMQYTGIKYENKDDTICVGDLFYVNGFENCINECIYFEEFGVIGYYGHWKTVNKKCFFDHFINFPTTKFYHVGNIHENPELIK